MTSHFVSADPPCHVPPLSVTMVSY